MKRLLFTCLYVLLCCATALAAKDTKSGRSLFDAWEEKPELNLELHVNFDSIEPHRRSVDFFPATFVENGRELALEVAIRGRFRRTNCAMPPLKLKFKKAGLRANGLNTHNDFKLVTHCTDDAAGQDALRREQLAYELYNTVNPAASFRTQLLTITYVNTVDGSTTTSLAILIEDTDELKNRLDAKNCQDCYGYTKDQIANAEQLALFQYMIGNVDYTTNTVRNLKLMQIDGGENVFVPYDFDYSGLVNANYARPQVALGQQRITDRVMVWDYAEAADFTAAADHFLGLKDTLLAQVDATDLDAGSKREVTKYLKGFFRDLKSGNLQAPAAKK